MSRLRPPVASACRASLCAAVLCAATAGHADPADYVFVPCAAPGERVLALAAGREQGHGGERENQQSLGVGWMPTARWTTSAYAAWAAEDGGHEGFDEFSWLNHVALTAPGSGPVDVGLYCNVERARDRAAGTGYTCGPTLQLDTADLQFNVNPWLEKHVGAAEPERTALVYQWQVKGLWKRGIELGAQGFGEFGPWNHWRPASQQSHALGPAIFFKWPGAGNHALRLDVAWLMGVGNGSPRDIVRLRLQQEF